MKIIGDKYYTPVDVANHCWNQAMQVIRTENITEIVEPSCGNGAFYHHERHIPDIGIDIEPECNYAGVIKADFLKQDMEYKAGRLVIGNPPYGRTCDMAMKFFKKSIRIADYVAFILPISMLHNTEKLYEFDLILSEDLGINEYSGKKIHCCFNVYRRPSNGKFNEMKKEKLKDVSIYREDQKGYDSKEYDIRMCYWGNSCAGKILKDGEHYAAEYKIKIHNEELKTRIIELLSNFDWDKYLKFIAMKKIQKFHIIKVLKENIKEIK